MATQSLDSSGTVLSLMLGAAPERQADIKRLWRKYNPRIEIHDNTRGITLNANGERIAFDLKTRDVFWLIGFSGWRAIKCYSPHVMCSHTYNKELDTLFKIDTELPSIERDYKERRTAVTSLIEAENTLDIVWPPDLPRPSANRDATECMEYKTAFDLTCLALAFALFHEFRHVMFDIDGNRPTDRRQEELACDLWARKFMTANAGAYAKEYSHSCESVLRKRSMGFALAALVLHDITPIWAHGGTADYFSLTDRLEAILGNTPLPDNDHFWIFTASLLLGVFRQKGEPLNQSGMSPRKLCECLIVRL